METTRKFPRTLQEAFPEDTHHRAEYGCAIIRTEKRQSYWPEWVMLCAVCVLAGYLLGRGL